MRLERKLADALRPSLGRTILERDVPALDISEIAQSREEGGQVGVGGRRAEEKHAEASDFGRRLRRYQEGRSEERKDERRGKRRAEQCAAGVTLSFQETPRA